MIGSIGKLLRKGFGQWSTWAKFRIWAKFCLCLLGRRNTIFSLTQESPGRRFWVVAVP